MGAPAGARRVGDTPMSNWRLTELFVKRSNATGRAYAVGIAIAHLGNRHEDGWTFARLDLIAQLSRLDRNTALKGIHDLEELGELEYERGRSTWNPSRYRIREDVLCSGRDRSRRDSTMDDSHTVTMGDSSMVTMEDSHTVTMEEEAVDHGRSEAQPWTIATSTMDESSPVSINRSLSESLTEPDQSAREGNALVSDDASKDAGVDQKQNDVVALKAALNACRRSVDGSTGEGVAEQS
jgi:hypothetical protein